MNEPSGKESEKILIVSILAYLVLDGLFWLATSWLPDTEISRYNLTLAASVATFVLAYWAMQKDAVMLESIGWTASGFKQALYLLGAVWSIGGVFIVVLTHLAKMPLLGVDISSLIKHWLFVGISEELWYRGYMMATLIRIFSKKGRLISVALGIAISSTIFAAIHIPQRMVIEGVSLLSVEMAVNLSRLFLVGVVLAWLFLRSCNILFVGLVHGGLNAPLVSGGSENPLTVITILLLALVVVEISRRRTDRNAVKSEA